MLRDLDRLEEMVSSIAKKTSFIFIDDGSTDDTVKQLSNARRDNLNVISHLQNQGPGAAFQTSFSYLIKNGLEPDDLVITLEGDATSEPKVFKRMLQRTEEDDDLVLASPYLYGGGFSGATRYRLFLSHCANFFFKLILGLRGLATFSCFYRIYRGRAIMRLHEAFGPRMVDSLGFECAAEVLFKTTLLGMTITEVPFRVDWTRRQGRSKMKVLKTSFGYFRLFWRYSPLRRKVFFGSETINCYRRQAPVH